METKKQFLTLSFIISNLLIQATNISSINSTPTPIDWKATGSAVRTGAQELYQHIRAREWHQVKEIALKGTEASKQIGVEFGSQASELYKSQDQLTQRGIALCGISLAILAIQYPIQKATKLTKRLAQLGVVAGLACLGLAALDKNNKQ